MGSELNFIPFGHAALYKYLLIDSGCPPVHISLRENHKRISSTMTNITFGLQYEESLVLQAAMSSKEWEGLVILLCRDLG